MHVVFFLACLLGALARLCGNSANVCPLKCCNSSSNISIIVGA